MAHSLFHLRLDFFQGTTLFLKTTLIFMQTQSSSLYKAPSNECNLFTLHHLQKLLLLWLFTSPLSPLMAPQ